MSNTVFMLGHEAFAVLGLRSSFEEILPVPPPLVVGAVLLPFAGVIVSDGLLVAESVVLGPGMRRGLKESYDAAVERGEVRTSLLPGDVPKRDEKARSATNRKVVTAFRRYLLSERKLSEKTVDRDTRIIEAFARGLAGGGSLLDTTGDDVEAMVASAATIRGGRAETVAALKRFYKFLVVFRGSIMARDEGSRGIPTSGASVRISLRHARQLDTARATPDGRRGASAASGTPGAERAGARARARPGSAAVR